MPRKQKQQPEQVEVQPVQEAPPAETQSTPITKEDYIKARATIKQYRETKKQQPKRPCSEKQLAALAKGRERNKRFAKKDQ